MSQPAYPRDSGEKNQDVEKRVFVLGFDKISPHYSQVFLVAMGNEGKTAPGKRTEATIGNTYRDTPKTGRLARVRCVVSCAVLEWAANGLCVVARH